MPTTTTLSISYSFTGSGATLSGGPVVYGSDLDTVLVPELSGTGSVVLYKLETDNCDQNFDSAGYNSGSGGLGWLESISGTYNATLRVSGQYVILSGETALSPHYGTISFSKSATAKVIVFGTSKLELYADSGNARPQLASLAPSGTISRIQYEIQQSTDGGKFSVKPIGNTLYRFR